MVAAALSALTVAAGCGGQGQPRTTPTPTTGARGDTPAAATQLGFPVFATSNTVRVGGSDAIANAAGSARAVFTAATPETRPTAVVLAPAGDWRIGLAASVLMGPPLRAPLLYTDGDKIPAATGQALDALDPRGSSDVRDAQVIRIATAADSRRRTIDVRGKNPFALARSIDALAGAARRSASDRVVIVSADAPQFAMPAAAWAAKSGDPILFTHKDELPGDTVQALKAHQRPRIYVLGPPAVISARVLKKLSRLGAVTRIGGDTPVTNAIAFARYIDGPFGWGIVDPGHGMVIASVKRPTDAAAVAPLSASGSFGPLLLTDDAVRLPAPLRGFLLDIQPGYPADGDPVRGVYNHAWIVGDEQTISRTEQSAIDSLLQIVPVRRTKDTNTP